MCSVENFEYDIKPMNKSDNSEFKHVTIKWSSVKGSPKLPIESWSLHFVESEKSSAQTYPALTFTAIKDLGVTKICDQRYNLSKCDAFITSEVYSFFVYASLKITLKLLYYIYKF